LVNERLNAGHFAWTTASDKFLEALVSKIRPVAIERGAREELLLRPVRRSNQKICGRRAWLRLFTTSGVFGLGYRRTIPIESESGNALLDPFTIDNVIF